MVMHPGKSGHLHHPPQTSLLRPFHEQQSGQVLEEDHPDPVGHPVRPGPAEVPVEDDHGNQDGNRVHEEGEQQVLGNERKHERGRRQDLGDQQQEDDQREQDRNTEGHFFSGLSRQVEDQDAEEGDEHRRQDQVDRIEKGLSADRNVE